MPVVELQRQTVKLCRQAIAQIKVKALRKTRHTQALRRIENERHSPDSQVKKNLLAARPPADRELLAGSIGRLNLRPDVVDEMRGVGGRCNRAHRIENDGDDYDHKPPALVCRLIP